MNAQGGFALAWLEGSPTWELKARRFHADGSPATDALLLSGLAVPGLDVALRSDGSFVTIWSTPPAGPLATRRLVVRVFGAGGHPLSSEITATEWSGPIYGSLGLDVQGGFVLVITKQMEAQSFMCVSDVWARRFDRRGSPLSSTIAVSPPGTIALGYFGFGVSVFPDGRFVVGYVEFDPLICIPDWSATLATFNAAGSPIGAVSPLPPALVMDHLSLVSDRTGNLATFGRYRKDEYHTGMDGHFRVANAGGVEVGEATVIGPQVAHGLYETEMASWNRSLRSGSLRRRLG
jgi:hypothetical protein